MEASDPMDKSMMYSWSSYVYIITSYLSNLLSILPRTIFFFKNGGYCHWYLIGFCWRAILAKPVRCIQGHSGELFICRVFTCMLLYTYH